MKKYLLVALLAIAAVVILISILRSWLINNPKYRFGADRSAVIKQIESLSRLETASFSVDKIIEAGTNYDGFRQFLFGDKLILIASGQVIAGFDLSQMQAKDFSGSGPSIGLKLPAPKIFEVVLNNSETKVFDRNQGIFTKGDINLESAARQKAVDAIREAACQGRILDDASKNADQQLRTIFKSAGFENVEITIPAGDCK